MRQHKTLMWHGNLGLRAAGTNVDEGYTVRAQYRLYSGADPFVELDALEYLDPAEFRWRRLTLPSEWERMLERHLLAVRLKEEAERQRAGRLQVVG